MSSKGKKEESTRSNSLNDRKAGVSDSPEVELSEWYHGYMPREETCHLLRADGNYLLRQSETKKGDGFQLVLSVRGTAKHWHFPVFATAAEGQLFVNRRRTFETVTQMVQHYVESGEEINDKTHAKLKTPIARPSWELNRDHIQLGPELGHGEYGTVHKGTLLQGEHKTPVAIKLLKVALDKTAIQSFAREAHLLRDYKHPNIVQFYGTSFNQAPFMLCMELADAGSLDKYLRKHKTSTATKLQLCVDAARGLAYLHSKQCVHRDVSARNCLISNGRVKISDFGLATTNQAAATAANVEKMPVRWLAPEAMAGNYSLASDVYSFGVLMWEIFTDAQVPFKEMPLLQVFNEVQNKGLRLERPSTMPEEVGRIMTEGCFGAAPASRWTMEQIRAALEKLLAEKYGGYIINKDKDKAKQPSSTRSAKQVDNQKSTRSNERSDKNKGGGSSKRTKSARNA